MGYIDGSNINSAIASRERELLSSGFSYAEVAEITGGRIKSISERNRLVYKINIWEAFENRIRLNGAPNRLSVSDDFGYWFSGFFDGEGCIFAFTRQVRGTKYSEFRLSVNISIRDDDAGAITRIQNNLKVGVISRGRNHGNTNPTIAWRCERVKDLAEVIVPLFDHYPLYTKKAKEFAIWKPIVLQRYINTLGGYSNRRGIPEDQRIAFREAIDAIKKIRTYRI